MVATLRESGLTLYKDGALVASVVHPTAGLRPSLRSLELGACDRCVRPVRATGACDRCVRPCCSPRVRACLRRRPIGTAGSRADEAVGPVAGSVAFVRVWETSLGHNAAKRLFTRRMGPLPAPRAPTRRIAVVLAGEVARWRPDPTRMTGSTCSPEGIAHQNATSSSQRQRLFRPLEKLGWEVDVFLSTNKCAGATAVGPWEEVRGKFVRPFTAPLTAPDKLRRPVPAEDLPPESESIVGHRSLPDGHAWGLLRILLSAGKLCWHVCGGLAERLFPSSDGHSDYETVRGVARELSRSGHVRRDRYVAPRCDAA